MEVMDAKEQINETFVIQSNTENVTKKSEKSLPLNAFEVFKYKKDWRIQEKILHKKYFHG